MKKINIFLSLAAAAAAGAAAGLLLAPRRGKETREDIAGFIKSHYPGLKNQRLSALADQIAQEVGEAKDGMKQTHQAIKAAAKASGKALKDEIKDKIDELKK